MLRLRIHNIGSASCIIQIPAGLNLEFISIICISKTDDRIKYFDAREICKKKANTGEKIPQHKTSLYLH